MPSPDLPGVTGTAAAVGRIADELDAAALSYTFTGALALAVWGEPRFSRDIDVVVHGPRRNFRAFVRALFPEEDVAVLLERARRDGHFVAKAKPVLGFPLPVDVLRPFLRGLDTQILRRSKVFPLPGGARAIPVVSPEDYIVYKLLFFRSGGGHDDMHDVSTVLRRQGADRLDRSYAFSTARVALERVFDAAEAQRRLAVLERLWPRRAGE